MATFTRLDDADVAALAAALGLGAVTAWRAIPAGTINTIAAVQAARGAFCLRVYEGKTAADVRYEADLVDALAAAGVPTPRPVRGPDGEPFVPWRDRLASAFPWVAGVHRDPGAGVALGVGPVHAARVGRALARLHVAGSPLAPRFARPGLDVLDRIRARFDAFRDTRDPALVPAVAAIAAELDRLDGQAGGARARAASGVIHGDLFPDNVLWDGDAIAAVLDFEQVSTGSLPYDLAVCLNAWCWRPGPGAGRIDPALVRAFVDGYRGVRPLPAGDAAALPFEVRVAAVRFAVTRITDVYLPGVDKPDKDFREYLAHLAAWAELGAPGLRGIAGLV